MQEKVGRGEDKGGMRDGRGVDPEVKMEEGASEGESPNRKEGLVLQKGERGGERVGRSLEKSPEIGCKMGTGKKKEHFAGQKTGAVPRKIARNRVRNGEKWEKRRFWSEKGGVGERRKNGLYCRFCNATRWQNGCK